MDEKKRIQIHNYLETFFGAIREFIQKEPQYNNFTPEIFKFSYVFLVFECLDGYVISAYPSGFADNYISIDQNKSVKDVLQKLPNLILGTEQHVVLGVDQWGGRGRWEVILDRYEINREPRPTTGWKFLYISTKDDTWSRKDARKAAKEFIGIFKARAAIYEPATGGGFIQNYDRYFLRREITTHLLGMLEKFESIISDQNFAERVIHRFLRDHPVMIYPTKKKMLYEYILRENGAIQYKIDFIIEAGSGRYMLVELENPNHDIFTENGDFTRAVNHAERQIEDWFIWIRQHLNEIEKDLPGILAPEGLVIIGRNSGSDNKQHDKLRMRNEKHQIKIITYDDLAEEARNHIMHLLEA